MLHYSMELSVVFPVLNEEHKIAADIEAAFAFMDDNLISGEVIIVDDGSTDNTAKLVSDMMTVSDRPLHLISYSPNRGKGYAVRQGIMAARGRIIMFADSGNCVPLD
ncbi:MAG: glycosyltransferase, partial [Marinilabiliales bacterium]